MAADSGESTKIKRAPPRVAIIFPRENQLSRAYFFPHRVSLLPRHHLTLSLC